MISIYLIFPAYCGVYFMCMFAKSFFYPIFFICVLFGCFLFSVGVVYAHGDEEHSGLVSQVSVCHSLSEGEREACYLATCESGVAEECSEDIVDAAVEGSGPKFAHAVLGDLDTLGLLDGVDVSLYGLAQRIGRLMAQRYAEGGPVTFMACETDYHYGCHYGFFTEVLSADSVSLDTISAVICDADASQQEMCYHRMGHMFLKHHAHVLPPALALCDALPSAFRGHCWDGVFMENVDLFFLLGGEVGGGVGGFLADDPFAPCNVVAVQYREQCYKNHGRYLVAWYAGAPFDVLDTCSDAGPYVDACRHSIRDALSGEDGHHTHGGREAHSRSWLQKIIDFIVGLFPGSDSSESERAVNRSGSDAERRAAAVAAVPDQPAVQVFSRMFPGGVAPGEVEHSAMISYRDGQFVPNEVRIEPGQWVLWMNEDQVFWPASNLHPTHREYLGSDILKCDTEERSTIFDACEAMGPGAAYAFQFNEVGAWKFHDHINPRATGTVIVSP